MQLHALGRAQSNPAAVATRHPRARIVHGSVGPRVFAQPVVPAIVCRNIVGKSVSPMRRHAPAPAVAGAAAAGPLPDKSGVLIIGGGPAGCAAALMLARRGWRDITIVEQQADPTYADPDKSYVYAIDGRGCKFLGPAGLTPALQAASVATSSMMFTMVKPDGAIKQRAIAIKDPTRFTQWLPRTAFMKLMVQALTDDPAAAAAVRLVTRTRASAITRDPDGRIVVTLEHLGPHQQQQADAQPTDTADAAAGSSVLGVATTPVAAAAAVAPAGVGEEVVRPNLLLACDGFRSKVRTSLEEWAPSTFRTGSFPSLSSGIRYKVLRLPPNPVTKDGTVLANASFAVVEGLPCKRLAGGNPLRLGLLPVADPAAPRTGNLNLLPDHPLWGITRGEEMYEVFEESFSQLDWRKLVAPEVMERYAASRGGTFPTPQYSTALTWMQPAQQQQQQKQKQQQQQQSSAAISSSTGVVLLGDAAHCFPPDLGQGVNSALEDVAVLDGALADSGDDLTRALPLYESRRIGDTEALIRLMQVGYPLQYKQYPWREKLFFAGFSVQLLLSKLLPWLVTPPIFMVVQDPNRSYSSIWAGAQRTRTVLHTLAAAAVAGVVALAARALMAASGAAA